MSKYQFVSTPTLNIGYLEWLPKKSPPEKTVMLMHGWPDCPEGWSSVAALLTSAGYRVIAPALRGFGPTRFHQADTARSGQLAALGRDLLDLIAALNLEKPVLAGHDWGARAVANACGLQPGVASHLILMSVGYGTNNPDQALSLQQVRNYWYQWYMATPRGARTVEDDRSAFVRLLWDSWAPSGWYAEADFQQALEAFDNPDWAAIVLHSYRHRWGFTEGDPAYSADESRLNPAPVLDVPTLILHGDSDPCNHPSTSADKEAFFSNRYKRELLTGLGHFPQREAPQEVARSLLAFLDSPD